MTVELVIAKYQEDMTWIHDPAFQDIRITIYDKSNTPISRVPKNSTVIPLQNPGGNEAHTYLWHMSQRYTTFSEYTAFVQGNPFDHIDYATLVDYVQHPRDTFVWLAHTIFQCDENALPHHAGLPLSQIYAAANGRITPSTFHFGVGGQFMIPHTIFYQQSQAHYERNRDIVIHGFVGHPVWCGYERFWDQLFVPYGEIGT